MAPSSAAWLRYLRYRAGQEMPKGTMVGCLVGDAALADAPCPDTQLVGAALPLPWKGLLMALRLMVWYWAPCYLRTVGNSVDIKIK